MKLRFLLLLLMLLGLHKAANAQQLEDVIYLKNNWIIHGTIINKTDRDITIRTQDRSVFVFSLTEVDHTARERTDADMNNKIKGFAHFTELGPLAARNTSQLNVNTSAFSFQTVNGYKFNQWLFVGAGVGVDLYATQTFFPVFGSVRGDLLTKRQFVPYYFLDAGYGINGTTNVQNTVNTKGGALYAAGLGLKIGLTRNAGVLISLGYRLQNYTSADNGNSQKNTYQRLALRAGFYL